MIENGGVKAFVISILMFFGAFLATFFIDSSLVVVDDYCPI